MDFNKQQIKDFWNRAVPITFASDYYDVQGFLSGDTSLQEAELALLNDIEGKKVLHLQCHFGQDTISLARLGANAVGVDISEKAIEKARDLAVQANQSNVTFVCSDINDLPLNLDEKFDIVFTSYGVLLYLSDLDKWGSVISHFLKPGGKFVIVEFHPVVGMFDVNFQRLEFEYFQSDPIAASHSETYADSVATIAGSMVYWNHGLAEVMTSLLKNGIQIQQFQEYDYSHCNCFRKTVKVGENKYRIEHLGNKIPLMYSIVGIKSKQ